MQGIRASASKSGRSLGAGLLLAMTIVVIATTNFGDAHGQDDLDIFRLRAMDAAAWRVKNVALLPVDEEPGQRLVYGDRYGVVRVVRITDQRVDEIWRSRTLEGGSVLEVLTEDLEGDGTTEILARTRQGRIVVFDWLFNPRWESPPEDYNQVSGMALANMDTDPAYEIVLLADGFLNYIDGSQFNREFRGTQTFRATEMAVGNVDNDRDLEIVLNTGTVIDAVTGEPQWETEPFGQFVELLDIDGDGVDEILGHTANQFLRIFDADDQQEKPLQ